ncbi:hypothetical protein L1987_87588 [Smallanthus sonchifolius]|nr:hypothetical protein L1987_87588 [Smallanthus sonchifolius]
MKSISVILSVDFNGDKFKSSHQVANAKKLETGTPYKTVQPAVEQTPWTVVPEAQGASMSNYKSESLHNMLNGGKKLVQCGSALSYRVPFCKSPIEGDKWFLIREFEVLPTLGLFVDLGLKLVKKQRT